MLVLLGPFFLLHMNLGLVCLLVETFFLGGGWVSEVLFMDLRLCLLDLRQTAGGVFVGPYLMCVGIRD